MLTSGSHLHHYFDCTTADLLYPFVISLSTLRHNDDDPLCLMDANCPNAREIHVEQS